MVNRVFNCVFRRGWKVIKLASSMLIDHSPRVVVICFGMFALEIWLLRISSDTICVYCWLCMLHAQKEAVVRHMYLGRNPPLFTEMRVLRQSTGDDHLVCIIIHPPFHHVVFILYYKPCGVSFFSCFSRGLFSCNKCRYWSWAWIFAQQMIWVQFFLSN